MKLLLCFCDKKARMLFFPTKYFCMLQNKFSSGLHVAKKNLAVLCRLQKSLALTRVQHPFLDCARSHLLQAKIFAVVCVQQTFLLEFAQSRILLLSANSSKKFYFNVAYCEKIPAVSCLAARGTLQ